MANSIKAGRHYGFIIVACCCLMMGVNIGITFSCAGIFYKPVSSSLGVSVGEFGLYMSIMYIASTLILPIGGKMIERFSARWLLAGNSALIGLTLCAMGMYALDFGNSTWQVPCAGITVAFLLYLSFPTLINRWFRVKVGLLMGICSAASGVGGMIFNPIGASIITSYGWQTAYISFGLFVAPRQFSFAGIASPRPSFRQRSSPLRRKIPGRCPVSRQGCGCRRNQLRQSRARACILRRGGLLFPDDGRVNPQPLHTELRNVASFHSRAGLPRRLCGHVAGVTIGKLALGHINDRNCPAGVLVTTLGGISGLLLMIAGNWGLAIIISGAFLFGWAYAGVTVQTATPPARCSEAWTTPAYIP